MHTLEEAKTNHSGVVIQSRETLNDDEEMKEPANPSSSPEAETQIRNVSKLCASNEFEHEEKRDLQDILL